MIAITIKGNNNSKKGIILAAIAGILMSFFYRFVAAAMDLNNFDSPTPGMATPYTAFFIFSIGIFLSNFLLYGSDLFHPEKIRQNHC
jgi:glucose uptake protein